MDMPNLQHQDIQLGYVCWNCHTYRPGVQPPATEALKAEDAEELSTGLLLDGSEPSAPSTQDVKSMQFGTKMGTELAK